jgi:hypothetical protein
MANQPFKPVFIKATVVRKTYYKGKLIRVREMVRKVQMRRKGTFNVRAFVRGKTGEYENMYVRLKPIGENKFQYEVNMSDEERILL